MPVHALSESISIFPFFFLSNNLKFKTIKSCTLNYRFAKIPEFNGRLGRTQMIKVIYDATVLKFLDQLEKVSLKYLSHVKTQKIQQQQPLKPLQ